MNKKNVCLLIISVYLIMPSFAFPDQKIKKPNVSGQFYEADPKKLSSHIDHLMGKAQVKPYQHPIDIIIAPHAGYIYSGGVAAHSFKAISQGQYKTIVVLAPSHFVGFDGISVWEEGGFETPLGVVEVDSELAGKLTASSDKVTFRQDAFAQEHSLEVEIPFLQKVFKDFKIVPVVMGQPKLETLQEFARTLNQLIGGRDDVLVVVSTDLSHYHDDAFARAMDSTTIKAIEELDVMGVIQGHQGNTMEMCGFIPVVTALLYAKEKGLNQADVLQYANSGDVSGDKDRVVGYTAIAIYDRVQTAQGQRADDLSKAQRKRLFDIAQQTVVEYVTTGKKIEVTEDDPRLKKKEGAFVTLRKQGRLRGCIGNVLGRGPLYLTVRDMAVAAASEDPRFNPVTKEELKDLDIEVSVLSLPWQIKDVSEIELGVHGVIVSQGFRSGLFLPEVASETGWSKEQFLSYLCAEKASLPADAWKDPKTKIEIFTTTKFTQEDVK
ncbi:MAG TPA: AmmeMemoRadiSam system protein B [Candidatus Omnitrophota bacterium]|nr:AmmeMemoRadiSam system protein B [Candidatus Omnitrophota bacterium]